MFPGPSLSKPYTKPNPILKFWGLRPPHRNWHTLGYGQGFHRDTDLTQEAPPFLYGEILETAQRTQRCVLEIKQRHNTSTLGMKAGGS